jgi:lipopolysaccharide transport system permease protein
MFNEPLSLIFRHRRMLAVVCGNELKARHAGTLLGIVWLFVYPALFLATYATVYMLVLKVRLAMFTGPEYLMLMFTGLVPFLNFAECLSAGTVSVSSNPQLMKNTLFPVALLPVKIVVCAQVVQVVGFAMLSVFLAASGKLGVNFGWVFVIWTFQAMISVGIVWILASVNVFFRDLGQIMGLVILLLMMVSPIGYTEEMIPAALRPILTLNPLYYIILCYQRVMLFNQPPPPQLLWPFVCASTVIFFAGYKLFATLKRAFVENV